MTKDQQRAYVMDSSKCVVLPRTSDVQSTFGVFDSIHASVLHYFCRLHVVEHLWGK